MAIKFLSGLNLSNVTAGSILKLDSNGNIVAATAGTDYAASNIWSTASSDNIYYSSGGVRIGTYQSSVDAAAQLHVFDYQTTDPKLLIEDGNTGDASMQFKISTQSYTMGIDNSDSDKFILAASSALGTTNAIEVSTTGVTQFGNDIKLSNGWTLTTASTSYAKFGSWVNVEGTGLYTTSDILMDLDDSSSRFVIRGLNNTEHFIANTATDTFSIPNWSLGIGTASPDSKLHVYASDSGATAYQSGNDGLIVERGGRASISLLSPAANDSYLFFGNPTAGNAGYVGYQNTENRLVVKSSDYISLLDSTGEVVRVDGGNVGIGTTSPADPLHISSGGTDDFIRIENTNTYTGLWMNDGGTNSGWLVMSGYTNTPSAGDFAIREYGVQTSLVIKQTTGNVGIGTNSPGSAFKLDVNGYIKANSRIYVRDSTKTIEIGTDYIQSYVTSGTAVNPIRFFTGSTEKARINGDGNVGIGTTSPQSKLHVAKAGNRNGGSMLIGETGSGTAKWSYLAGAHYNQATGSGNGSGSAGMAIIGSLSASTYNRVYVGGGPYEINPATDIRFSTHNATTHNLGGSQRMIINSSGNVGVGTGSPSTRFSVRADTANHRLVGINRANSDVAALYLGNNSSNDAIISGNNAPISLGKDVSGTYTEYVNIATDGELKFSAYGAGILKTNASGIVSLDTNTYLTSVSVDWNDIGSVADSIDLNSTVQIGQGDTETLVSFQNSGTERGRFEVDDSANSYFVATGFKTSTTSTGFLKADGTVDTGDFFGGAYSDLTGTPTLGTMAAANTSDYKDSDTVESYVAQELTGYATETYVGTQISNLVDSSPAALDTLNELAAALGDDASFSTTVTTSIATKLPLAGGTLTGKLKIDTRLQIGDDTSSSNDYIYDGYLDANSAYFHQPKVIIRSDSSAAGGLDEAPVALAMFNRNGTNNTWVKMSFASREVNGGGNTVSIAGIAAQKTTGTSGSWASGKLYLWTKNGASFVENMVLQPNGNVGVGTSSPGYKLDVAGTIRSGTTYRTSINGDASGAVVLFGSASDNDSLGVIGAYASKFNISSGNGDMSFQFNSTERMLLASNGDLKLNAYGAGILKTDANGNVSLDTNTYLTSIPSEYLTETEGDARYVSYESLGREVPAAGGWYRLAKLSRGGARFAISYTGGNMSPHTYIIDAFKNWNNEATISVEKFGHANYITGFRISRRTGEGNNDYYLEANFTSLSNTHSFEARYQEVLGYTSISEIYSVSSSSTLVASNSDNSERIEEVTTTTAEGLYLQNINLSGRLNLYTDSNTTSTTALVLNGTEVEKRTLGSNAFSSTSFLPLAGGTMTGNVIFNDSKELRLGTSSDFKGFHNGTNTHLSNYTGQFVIENYSDDKDILFASDDGSGGVTTYMYLDGSITETRFTKPSRHNDSVIAKFGDGNDLNIFHNGSNSYIETTSSSTGDFFITARGTNHDLYLEAADNIYLRPQGNENGIIVVGNGAVQLYYDNAQKFVTTSTGVSVDGKTTSTDQISVNNRTAISVGHWSASGSSTGAIRITIPGSHSSNWSMLVLRITAYEYNSTNHTIYYVSGHDWTSGWYNNGVTKMGDSNKDIKLGYDSSKDYVLLGGVSDTWSYGHVTVDVMAHPSFYNGNMDITSGWDVRQTTDISGITTTAVTNRKVLTTADEGSGNGIDADTVDGLQASSFLRSDAADTMRFDTSTGEMLKFQNSTSGGKIQIGFQQNDTDGLHHRAYFKAYKSAAGNAAGKFDIVIRSAGGGTTADIFELEAGAKAKWQGNNLATETFVTTSYKTSDDTETYVAQELLSYTPTSSLGTAAFSATGDFATAAQGTTADAALPKAGGTMSGNINLGDTNNAIGQSFVKSGGSLNLIIDSNNNQTVANFIIEKDTQTAGSGTELFRVQENGRVGIATNAPTKTLDVNGSSYFRGTIGVNGEGNGITVDSGYSNNGRVGLMKYGGLEGMLVSGNATKLRLGRRTDATTVATPSSPTIVVDIQVNTDGTVQLPQYSAGILKTNASGVISLDTNTYLTSYTETDTLDSVLTRGDVTNNTIHIRESNRAYTFRTAASWGGWARTPFYFEQADGTGFGGLGAYGGNGTTLSKYYIGTTYNDNIIEFHTDDSVIMSGNLTLPEKIIHSGDTDTYIKFDTNRVRIVAGNITKFDSDTTYTGTVQSVTGTGTVNGLSLGDDGDSVDPTLTLSGTISISSANITDVAANADATPSWVPATNPNYLTSYTETDTFSSVTGRGASTTTSLSIRNLTSRTILPEADKTYNLGAEETRWAIVYCETLDSAGQHESKLQNPEGEKSIGDYATGTVLVWKGGKNIPCTEAADHMRMGIAVNGIDSPLVQGAEPVLVTGSVNEGDYLVTSSVEGHAKAITPQFMRQHMLFDCVIGKALESGKGDSHLIKTWINI